MMAQRSALGCWGRWKLQSWKKKVSACGVILLGIIWGIAAFSLWVNATQVVNCFTAQTKETLCMNPVEKAISKQCINLGMTATNLPSQDYALKAVESSVDKDGRLTLSLETRGKIDGADTGIVDWWIMAQIQWHGCCQSSVVLSNPMMSPFGGMSQHSEGDYFIYANYNFIDKETGGGMLHFGKRGEDGELSFDTITNNKVTFAGTKISIVTEPLPGILQQKDARLQLLGSMVNGEKNCTKDVAGNAAYYQTCLPEMSSCYMESFTALVAAVGLVAMLPLILCFAYCCKGCIDFFCLPSVEMRPYEMVGSAGTSSSVRNGARRRRARPKHSHSETETHQDDDDEDDEPNLGNPPARRVQVTEEDFLVDDDEVNMV